MFPNASAVAIHGGTFMVNQNRTSKGMDILMEWVATGAFHNSDELYDAPRCHPHTRVAVLDDIMQWVKEAESERNDFMMWLFGPAGAGKSAIAKRIAEIAAEKGLLIGDFFFSRTSSTRNTKDRLIATLAYQLTVSIPDTRSYMEDVIERDPAIFRKNIQTQIDTLLLRPLQSVLSTQIVLTQKLMIIDGLDECDGSGKAQIAILEALSRTFIQQNLPIKFLVVSRPEQNIVTAFNCSKLLKSIHRRLALDDTYQPDNDIRLFFSDTFEQIRLTHPLRSIIPSTWPAEEILDTLVEKSSGQFIYASTVVKFVESNCHRPIARLNIILGISPPGKTNPFAELDALYNHLLSSVDDIQITLRVLSLYIMTPDFESRFRFFSTPRELFLSLEPGDIQLALVNLSSILTYDESSGEVKVFHASLVDFLSDKCRSTIYYIDQASTCADFIHRILQCVQGPNGILAGHGDLFRALLDLYPWILKGELRSDISHFDLDAFINASITRKYKGQSSSLSVGGRGCTLDTFWTWNKFLNYVGLEDSDKKEALDGLNKSLDSRLRIYRSHWQLQLLLTLTVFADVLMYFDERYTRVLHCRYLDILLEMHDHHLHLVDQDALDLRHSYVFSGSRDYIHSFSLHVAHDDAYASAALHCMRFLSNPPKYSESNEHPEMGPTIYVEWNEICLVILETLCQLLQQASTSSELVEFLGNHDIHPAFQKNHSYSLNDVLWEADLHILTFLARASVFPNWRIISAIERSPIITDRRPPKFNYIASSREEEATPLSIRMPLDQCCLNGHEMFV